MRITLILIALIVLALVIACGWVISCFQRDVYCLDVSSEHVVEYMADGGTMALSIGTDGDPFRAEGFDHMSYDRAESGWLGHFAFSRSPQRTEVEVPFWFLLMIVGGVGVVAVRWSRARKPAQNQPNKSE